MAPGHRGTERDAEVSGKKCTDAAVLVLIGENESGPYVTLISRPGGMTHHASQVSFPGGRVEPGESKREAALREAQEEIGVRPGNVDIVGKLTPLYIPPSRYCVFPFVGLLNNNYEFVASPAEVDEIILAPLSTLLSADARSVEQRILKGAPSEIPYFGVGDYKIWGATAMLLAELTAIIQD